MEIFKIACCRRWEEHCHGFHYTICGMEGAVWRVVCTCGLASVVQYTLSGSTSTKAYVAACYPDDMEHKFGEIYREDVAERLELPAPAWVVSSVLSIERRPPRTDVYARALDRKQHLAATTKAAQSARQGAPFAEH
jgi:hypothetical protein